MQDATSDLTRFLLRTRPLRFVGGIAVGAAVITVLLLTSLQSLRTSPSQIADQMVGRFEHSVQSQSPFSQDASSADAVIRSAILSAGASEVLIGYRSFDLQVPSSRGTLLFLEQDWGANPLPEAYSLDAGRWPANAGEVVVTYAIDREQGHSRLELAPGETAVTVVGTIAANYARESAVILAAPGTWAILQAGWRGNSFQPSATRDIFWNGGVAARVLPVLSTVLHEPAEQVQSEVWQRASLSGEAPNLGPEEWAVGIGGPLVASAAGGIYLALFVRRLRFQLNVLGVPAPLIGRAALSAGGAVALAGAAVGVAVGFAIMAVVIRPIIDGVGNSVPGEVYGVPLVAGLVCAAAVIGTVGVLLVVVARPSRQRSQPRRHTAPVFVLSAVMFFLLGLTIIRQAASFDGRVIGMLLAGMSVVATAPVLWPLIFRATKRGDAVDLGFRRLQAERRSASVTATAIAALIVLGVATHTMVTSVVDTANAASESSVAPNQIHFRPQTGAVEADRAAVHAVQEYLGLSDPIEMIISDGRVTAWDGPTLLVASRPDLERLVGRLLSEVEADTLSAGGTLRTKAPDHGSVDFQTADGKIIPLPSALISGVDPSFRTVDGFMLRSVAESLGIGTSPPTFVFTNVGDSVIASTGEAAEALGIDPRALDTYRAPNVFVAPLTTGLSAAAVAVLAGLALLVYGGGMGRRMRPHLASLRSLGLPRQWLVGLVGTQLVGIAVVALVFGAAGGLLGSALMLSAVGVGSTSMPWAFLGVLATVLTGSSAAAIALTTRRLKSDERLDLTQHEPAA